MTKSEEYNLHILTLKDLYFKIFNTHVELKDALKKEKYLKNIVTLIYNFYALIPKNQKPKSIRCVFCKKCKSLINIIQNRSNCVHKRHAPRI